MDRDNLHCGATPEIIAIKRSRKSPEILRLVERRLDTSRPESLRRKFDMNAQRQDASLKRKQKKLRGDHRS